MSGIVPPTDILSAAASALASDASPPIAPAVVDASLADELAFVDALVRDVSRKLDPIDLAGLFERATQRYFAADRWLTLSRLGLEYPRVRITRSSDWTHPPDPWKEPHKLPLVRGGVLPELIYDVPNAGPRFVESINFDPEDPGAEYLRDMQSMAMVPVYDVGRQLHVGVWLWRDATQAREAMRHLPMMIWLSNLFARTSHALTLRRQLQAALEVVEDEMSMIGRLQESLLPTPMPSVDGVKLAAHHQTARRAGGDYYDVRVLGDDTLQVFIGDVSGHGASSTVGVGVVHALVRSLERDEKLQRDPGASVAWLNEQITRHYTKGNGRFVTAFYACYDVRTRLLRYANAGHPPPRVKRGPHAVALPGETGLPLGVDESEQYLTHEVPLAPGDAVVLFTDGCFESSDRTGKMLGLARLDELIAGCEATDAASIVAHVRERLQHFAGSAALADDAVLLAMSVDKGMEIDA
jgi:sigma-B regulation protein RsbU (phosphoserine phosphatase)